jgi:hypothetical protein
MESAQEVEEFEQLSDSLEVWEWIERSRQRDVIYQIIYKQLMHGMLSDFCHFIYESLAVHCGVPSLVPADEQEARCRRRRTGEWEFAT